MKKISKEEAKYLRSNGGEKYVKTVNKQAKSKKKTFYVIESTTALNLLKNYWTEVCRVIYDSREAGKKNDSRSKKRKRK